MLQILHRRDILPGGDYLLHVMKYSYFTYRDRLYRLTLFVFLWVLGVSFGALPARIIFYKYNPLMLVGNFSVVSIVPMILVKIFPLIISIFISLYISDHLILMLAFIRSFLFGFCIGIICYIYSSAAWLVHILLLFSGLFVNVILLHYWMSILLFHRRSLYSAVVISGIVLMVVIVEQCFIVPLLGMLNI